MGIMESDKASYSLKELDEIHIALFVGLLDQKSPERVPVFQDY